MSGTDHPVALRHDEVRVFVAMPGSTMGDTAGWSSIPEIRRRLLEPVATRIGEILAGRRRSSWRRRRRPRGRSIVPCSPRPWTPTCTSPI
ncbi:hypothetical protein ACFQ60_00365 [Streptomyces zhihengii]